VAAIMLFACGDSADFLGNGDDASLEIISTKDGEILSGAASLSAERSATGSAGFLFFKIHGNENNKPSLKLEIDLFNEFGDSVGHSERISPEMNTDLPIEIPTLAEGQYDMVLSLFQQEKLVGTERRVFFSAQNRMELRSVQSYPLVISPLETILLIADTGFTGNENTYNPFFRWSYGRTIIARGSYKDGYDQILWEAPKEEGVYTVTVEIFPSPPANSHDFKFESPYKATTDLYVSAKKGGSDSTSVSGNVYHDLFSIYVSALREREKHTAPQLPQLRRPTPVIIGETIGMKFNGQAGFVCPELIFPIQEENVKPFTVSLGVTLEGEQAGKQILTLTTTDSLFSLDFFFDAKRELVLRLKVKGREHFFPSGIKNLEPGKRYLIEYSLESSSGFLQAVWSLNSMETARTENPLSLAQGEKRGYTIIGGQNGIRGIIDQLDVILK